MRVMNRPSTGALFGILTGRPPAGVTRANDRVGFHRVSDGGFGTGFGNAVDEEGQDAVPNAWRAR